MKRQILSYRIPLGHRHTVTRGGGGGPDVMVPPVAHKTVANTLVLSILLK